MQVRAVQDWYKLWAVVLPPIPPLLVGLAVFFNRRAKEREGVARSRLKVVRTGKYLVLGCQYPVLRGYAR